MYKPNSYFVQSPLWPLRKSHRRSLLTFCKRMAGCGVCIFPCLHVCSHISDFVLLMCMHNEIGSGWRGTPRKRERWRDRNKKKWSTLINQVKVQPVAGATAIFFFPLPCFPTFDASIFSPFNLINLNKCRRRGQGGLLSAVSDEVCRYLSSNRSWSKACLCPCRQKD